MTNQVSIEAIFRNVQLSAYEPFRERRLPLKCFLPWTAPGELARFAAPEFVRLFNRLTVKPLILGEAVNSGVFGKFFRRFKDTLLNQMGFNIRIVHDNGVIHATRPESPAQRKVRTVGNGNDIVPALRFLLSQR